jgi:hypothetical protein
MAFHDLLEGINVAVFHSIDQFSHVPTDIIGFSHELRRISALRGTPNAADRDKPTGMIIPVGKSLSATSLKRWAFLYAAHS